MRKYIFYLIALIVWQINRKVYLIIIRKRGYRHVPIIVWIIMIIGMPTYFILWNIGILLIQILDVIAHFEDNKYEFEHSKFMDQVILRMHTNRALKLLKKKGYD